VSFPELLEAALEGTLRHSPPSVLPEAEAGPAELRLLRAAAFEGMRRLAGRQPQVQDQRAALEPSPPETKPEANAASAQRLLDLLARRRDLVPEWFELARARGVRLPAVVLPDVLDQIADQPHLHDAVKDVGGERLAWLAARNVAWSFAASFDPVDRFVNGDVDERRRALRWLRRTDPRRGRELLAEAWSMDSAATRAALLPLLVDGLSAHDEPLLERGLHDRRKDIRQAALALLRRLPDSTFAARWAERARTILTIRSESVNVREPRVVDASWLADGLEPIAPRGVGATDWVLTQVIAFAPCSIWPRSILPAVLASDWADPLLKGLAQSASSHREGGWAADLLLAWTTHESKIEPDRLLAALPRDDAEKLLRQLMEEHPQPSARLVAGYARSWSVDFSRAFLHQLPRMAKIWQYSATAPLGQAALSIDPSVMQDAVDAASAIKEPGWMRLMLERLVHTLEVRHTMRQELG